MTIFKKIIDGKLPCDKVYEDEDIIAFKDIKPLAPIHILIVPKKEIVSLQAMQEADFHLLGKVAFAAQKIATELGLEDYRLITNNGPLAGQTVFHLHFHLIGGRALGLLG
jgi:histidine triad (HIT) family protein